MDQDVIDECVKLSKEYRLYDECITDGKFDTNKFKDHENWYHISVCQCLSEEFIREFKNKLNWYSISCHQTLSEEFIREFKDRVFWYNISCFQILSKDFICENLFNIDINRLLENKKIELDN